MTRIAVAAVGLVAGLMLAAGPATAAAAGGQPFSLSVSPGRLAGGTAGSVRTLTVTNTGTRRVTVRAELSELSRNGAGRCAVGPLGTLPWAKIRPVSLTLRPGSHKTARLRIGRHVPGGAHDLVAAFVAAPARDSGGVTVSGAVGAQMLVQGHGAPAAAHPCLTLAAAPRKPHIAARPPAASTVPWALVAAGAALAAVIVALLVVIVRQRRRIRASTPAAAP